MDQRDVIYGRVLVFFQIPLILVLLALGWWGVLRQWWLWPAALAAAVLGVSAVMAMRLKEVRVTPAPAKDSQLCACGVYRWIRHPMYAASLLLTGVFAIGAASWLSAILWLILVAILVLKLRLEERLWLEHSPEYETYMRRTKRLIPFVY